MKYELRSSFGSNLDLVSCRGVSAQSGGVKRVKMRARLVPDSVDNWLRTMTDLAYLSLANMYRGHEAV